MKVVQINATCGKGSTGKIVEDISKVLSQNNIENYVIYSLGESKYNLAIQCASEKYIKFQAAKSRILGNWGFNSINETKKIIRVIDNIRPDIVHLHNIHGHDCNLEMLFEYFSKNNTKLIWTFHDCWAFTGYCMHYSMYACDKWKNVCNDCIQKKEYSLLIDKSKAIHKKKKELFSGVDLTIITPSQWLANELKGSFMKNNKIQVINNGIDLEVFKPRRSKFRQKFGVADDKYILLGVANGWSIKKGIDIFVELSKQIDCEMYQIVLVGTDEKTDKLLPENIISIHRTHDQKELAEIYSAADVFLNPTREENFPTVNIEALACGTPVITFRTGGSPEIIDESCGSVVECNDFEALINEIQNICLKKLYYQGVCRKRAEMFDKNIKFEEYVKLYKELMNE